MRIALWITLHACLLTGACASDSDWPQWRGPNRDGLAVNSPKLLDSWPKEGPPLLWKSEWIPGFHGGGCAGPVVAGGKVFVYVNAKNPKDGNSGYRFITPDILMNSGWIPDLPDDLAKTLETAWAASTRPHSKWNWCDFKNEKESDAAVDTFLTANPELDKYVKDFIATLNPDVAKKYGNQIRRRLCINHESGYSWDVLGKLNKLVGTTHSTVREWAGALRAPTGQDHKSHHLAMSPFLRGAMRYCTTPTDTIVCLDLATGKTLWKKDFPIEKEAYLKQIQGDWDGRYIEAGEFLGISATPTVWSGKCYFIGTMGVYCVSAKDGTLLWQVKREDFGHQSVLVADGVVYHNGAAYDAESGAPLWKTPLWKGKHQWQYTSPSLWYSGGKTYILCSDGDRLVCCLDLKTGKDIWTLKYNTPYCFSDFAIRADGDTLASEGKIYKMSATTNALQATSTFIDFPRMVFGEKVIYQDHLYQYVGGQEGSHPKLCGLSCFDLKTGELNWSDKHPAWGTYPYMIADGKLIMPFDGDYVWGNWRVGMIQATPEKYIQLGLFEPGLIPWAALALADGNLIVRREDCIACYDLKEHGAYLDGVAAAKNAVTLRFKQTGGGIVAKDMAALQIIDAAGAAKPVNARIDGESIVVDTPDVLPFDVVCASTSAFTTKDGRPLPAIERKAVRLQIVKCVENTLQLTASQYVGTEFWRGATFKISGAAVTKADGGGNGARLTTDKAWKAGETVSLVVNYPCFPNEPGNAATAQATLTATAVHAAVARFVKADATTSGNWKGVYGSQGAKICGDTGAPIKGVTINWDKNALDARDTAASTERVWSAKEKSPRAVQKLAADSKERIAAGWIGDRFDIDVGVTDAQEHQVAFYCLDWDNYNGGRVMKVEVRDPDTGTVLDTQTVNDFKDGKYLVWNVQGQVAVHFVATGPGNWHDPANGAVAAVFVDPAAPTPAPPAAK